MIRVEWQQGQIIYPNRTIGQNLPANAGRKLQGKPIGEGDGDSSPEPGILSSNKYWRTDK